jgi:hypothetical protein
MGVMKSLKSKASKRPFKPGPGCAQVDGDLWDTARFVDSVRLPYIAPSLGGVESLIEQPTVISYWDQARPYKTHLQPCDFPQPGRRGVAHRAAHRHLLLGPGASPVTTPPAM